MVLVAAGLWTADSSVVVVVDWASGVFFSTTVVQADRIAATLTAVRHIAIGFFIDWEFGLAVQRYLTVVVVVVVF